jgi:DNA polymerase (family X)
VATGSLRDLKSEAFKEGALYRKYGLSYIEPELREGHDEVTRAKASTLPVLITAQEIRGDLRAHSMSSDGVDSIEDMAEAARERRYGYIASRTIHRA